MKFIVSAMRLSALCLIAGQAFTQDLPTTLQEAVAAERSNALPRTPLYQQSYDLKDSKPGALLAQEPFAGYRVKGLGRAVRIAYHSVDDTGRDVVTTGVVLVPAGTAPTGGWPLIAWGHGTSGVARACAPSLMRDVWYGEEGLSELLQAGFALVATDYHGLGSEGLHPYINKGSQARDILYSVPAARHAMPELGRRWVSDGHSQGGLASWGVAELESEQADPDYLGSVSVSGAVSIPDFLSFIDEHPQMSMYLPLATAGIQARYSDFEPRSLLTPAAMTHYQRVTTSGCWSVAYVTYKNTPPHGALQPGWRENPYVKHWADDNTLGRARITKPLFVITGEADQTVPIAGARATVGQACSAGSNLAFRSYPGLDHDPTMIQSVPAQLEFIRARFAGEPFKSTCPNGHVP